MIYCVEDEDSIRNLMTYALEASGFTAKGFPDSVEFFKAVAEEKPDLVLLDIMLPGKDGLDILRSLRADPATAKIPVIMASARGTEFDKVTGLDLGADDYLAKPFGMMEMVSRIRAVLRRTTPATAAATLGFDGLCMDPNAHTLTLDGASVVLTLKEFALLRFWKIPVRSLQENSSWSRSGRPAMWGRPGPLMSTWGPCGPSWAGGAATSGPSGAWAIDWRSSHEQTDFSGHFPDGPCGAAAFHGRHFWGLVRVF